MKKNIIYNLIYQILILALPLITVPYVSRILGANGIGTYSYTYSIAYYFILGAMLGINNYGNRVIAKNRDDKEKMSKEFCSIYYFQIITSLVMVIFYLIYVINFDNQYKSIAIIQSIYVISAMFDINWFYFGIEKFKLTIVRNTIIKAGSLIMIYIFVKNANDVWKYALILSSSTLFSNLVLFTFLKKYIVLKKVTFKEIAKHLKPCIILFIPVIAVSIYRIMDKIMLGTLSTIEEVGYYENAEKIIQVPTAIISALGTVMLPRISNMISKKQETEVKLMLKKTMQFVMFLAFAMMFGIIAVSNDFSIIYFGKEFKKSGILMQLLSVTIIFLAWGNVIRTQYLIPKEKDKEYVVSAIIAAIINLVMNCIFIPKWGSIGACIGTITAEFIVAFYQSYAIKQEIELAEYAKNSIGFILKAFFMFIVIIIIGKMFYDNLLKKIIIQICVGCIVYIIINIKYVLKNIVNNAKTKTT